MKSEELEIVPGSVVEPLAHFWIEGLAGFLWGDGGIPVGSNILHLQLIGSACEESANEKEFLIPNWGAS